MKNIRTADLCDGHEGKIKIAAPLFKSYGMRKSFGGQMVTVKVFEDNVLVKEALSQQGNGRVLVVDGGGSLRCALMGDNLARMALNNEWEGVIINGCIRDSGFIDLMSVAVKALNAIPLKSKKGGQGEVNVPVTFAGVSFVPGEYVYADEDGIIVSPEKLI